MTKKPYSLLSFDFWKAYGITLRPYLFFVSGIAGFYGIVNNPGIPMDRLVIGTAAFFLVYGLGQALTDVFQTDTDSISAPYRPLVQGKITKNQVFGVSMTGLIGCAAVFTVFNPWTLVPGLVGILGLILYTFFKRRWWSGPFWNSWIVAVLVLMGKMMLPQPFARIWDKNLVFGMLSVFFSYAAFVLTGYLKDISADRRTNYRTIPVKFGWRPAVGISLVFVFLAILFSFLLLRRNNGFYPTSISDACLLVIWAAGILLLVFAHMQLLVGKEDEKKAYPGIGNVVRGYLLIHIAESLMFKPALVLGGIVYYLLFEVVLFIRPEKSQV
jgi:4-hydroxybenzoate polyprenyltransferase